jgi:hypothetical protein
VGHPPRETIPADRCESCPHFAPVGEITQCTRCDCQRHVAKPRSLYAGHDPETPPGAEAALQTLGDALSPAREALEAAANEEVDAELARDAAHRKWMLQAPPVRRNELTVAERDAWVAEQIADEERAYRLARAKRQAAAKVLDVLGKQISAQQSISRSVSTGYQGTGRDGW